jgi:hypothetical protein
MIADLPRAGRRRRGAMTIARLPKSLMLEAYRMPADAPL